MGKYFKDKYAFIKAVISEIEMWHDHGHGISIAIHHHKQEDGNAPQTDTDTGKYGKNYHLHFDR